ncbi:Peptidase C39 family protein [compost metagenome]
MRIKDTSTLLALGLLMGCGTISTAAPAKLPPMTAEAYFITQYTHPRWHPEATPLYNANCGPTSLAMVLKAFGKVESESVNQLVRQVRFEMTGHDDDQSWTYPAQFPHAAARFGIQSQIVRGGAEAILQAMARPGSLAIVNVNPTPAYSSQLAHPVNGGHFAVVTRAEGNRITLNDPLADGPITITRDQLATALTTPLGRGIAPYNGGIVLWTDR